MVERPIWTNGWSKWEITLQDSCKTIRTLSELVEVLLDVEIALNNKLMSCVEGNVQMLVLAPNSSIYKSSMIPEDDPDNIIDKDFREWSRFINKCKEAVWSRWRREHLASLHERHKIIYGKEQQVKAGDMVIIKGDGRNWDRNR